MTHGLRCEAGIVPPHLNEAVARHFADLEAAYRPEGGHQRWLLGQAAEAAAQLDLCRVLIRAQQADQMDRADLCWEIDRETEVERLALRLPRNPAHVARQLRRTAHGCRWLLARWAALKVPLAKGGGWDEDQRDRAARLLGVGPDLRDLYPCLGPDGDPAEQAELAADQIADLQASLVESLDPIDAKERDLTQRGIPLRPSAEESRLRRYETRLFRHMNESLNEFRRLHAEGFTGSEPITALEPEPEPIPLAGPEPEPEPEPDGTPMPSKLVALAETIAADAPAPTTPAPSAPAPSPTTSAPTSRQARRALERARRKGRTRRR